MAIQGFFTGDVKIRDLNGVLRAVEGIVEVATDAGTVTSVGLSVGSTGTDVNVANSPITSSGNITLNLPTASATNRGLLSSTDWAIFSAKQGTITLTTTGNNGSATLTSGTLNIPTYTLAGLGGISLTSLSASSPLSYNNTTGAFSIQVANGSQNGYLSSSDWTTFNSKQGALTFSSPLVNTAGTISIPAATSSVNGYLTSADWTTFNAKQGAITLTTTGSSGAATLIGTTLNIPNYSGALTGYVPYTGATANVDLGTYDLTADIVNANDIKALTSAGLDIYSNSGTHIALMGAGGGAGVTFYGGIVGTTGSFTSNGGSDTFAITHSSGSGIALNITKGGSGEGLYINKTSGSGNAATIIGTLEATTLVKTGGTSSQFLKADGSVDSSTYYLASNPSAFIALTSLSATAPLSYSNTTGVFSISQATTSTDGYLSSTDWNTFNGKQAAGSYITALTGEATASGPGSATLTLSTSAVTGKLLTGLNLTGGGTIAATDSILQAFGKVQNQISGMVGGVTFQGTWNASTNTPTLTSSVGTKGYYYIVDVAGSTNLNGITDWKIGDWAIFNGSTWDKVDNTDAVSSVNGFTGAVSLTTSNIAEGTNLYYLDSRARLALSFTAGSGAYDNTTGVITIPTNTSQLTNGANFITLSSLSASSPLAYNSGSGAFSIQVANGSQNGYLSSSDWTTFNSKQNAITLTTTGSSGSSTLVGATLNVPTYTLSGLGGVPTTRQLTINGTAYDLSADRSWSVGTHTGSLTSGYIPKATGTTSLTDSLVYDTGTAVLIGTTTASTSKFMVYSTTADNHYQAIGSAPSFRFADTITSPTYTGIVGLATASNHFIIGAAAGDMVLANNTTSSIGNFIFGTGTTERMRITPTGNVSINNTNNTYRFDVNGTVRFTGQLRLESTITDGTYTYTLPSATGTLALTSAIPANPVGGTGTTNYLPKFTGTSTIGNSAISDDGTTVTLLSRPLSFSASTSQAAGSISRNATYGLTLFGVAGVTYDFGLVNKDGNQVMAVPTGTINTVFSGNLGLGTATPNQLLHLYKASSDVLLALQKGSNYGYVVNDGTNIGFASDQGSTGYKFLVNRNAPDNAMIINASGNLGLGVTPSASWATGFRALQMTSGVALISHPTVPIAYLSANYLATDSGAVYISSNFASRFLVNGYSGGFSWDIAPSGTAGNAISFTQAMTLNASGNLSIGNTNDTYKLDVSGTGRFTGILNANGGRVNIQGTNQNAVWFNQNAGGSSTGYLVGRSYTTTDSQDFFIYDVASATRVLAIASTGAATFSSSVTATSLALNGSISNSGDAATLTIKQSSTSYTNGIYLERGGERNGYHMYIGGAVDSLTFRRNYFGTQSDVMALTRDGNVGIGTTSPTGLLHIYGTDAAFRIQNNGTGNMQFGQWDGTNNRIQSSGRDFLLTQTDSFNMLFHTNSTERMRITSGGNVLIGTTTEATEAGLNIGAKTTDEGGQLVLQKGTSYTYAAHVDNYQDLFRVMSGTNTTSSSVRMSINLSTGNATFNSGLTAGQITSGVLGTGTVYSNSGVLTNTNPSDLRLKTNVSAINYGLNEILKLNPVTFNWKDDKINQGKQYGFIAQEVGKIMPDLVKNLGVEDYLGLDKEAIFTILVRGMQEQQAQIEQLKSQLNK